MVDVRCEGSIVHKNAYVNFQNSEALRLWFEKHVTLSGKSYTLDEDQANAVFDQHQNTLVVARAGSGKTRVIVAKVTYLLACCNLRPEEIAVFMFNRTAAAEVNQRMMSVMIDQTPLFTKLPKIASTFHKFALDIVKVSGETPQILSEEDHAKLIEKSLETALKNQKLKVSSVEKAEILGIVSNFVNRAGQSYPNLSGLKKLRVETNDFISTHGDDLAYAKKIYWHKVALSTYEAYLGLLKVPQTDFNLLMSNASDILSKFNQQKPNPKLEHIANLKYLMIDEYQDFSYLFFKLVQALRKVSSHAKLFAVGDDWQAINRFAGSNVDYFINFAKFFPYDQATIPLATNYRSDRRIVEYANRFMLTNYDPKALPATSFNSKKGKIRHINPSKIHFSTKDIKEDGLSDGRFMKRTRNVEVAKLLKVLTKIIRRHPYSEIMLLHRHNFTSFKGIDLQKLDELLKEVIAADRIMSEENYARQVRIMTMHKSKGLEADVVILLEVNRKIVYADHPHATIFELFGDTLPNEIADQQRLLYVALTRAKHKLYLLSTDRTPPV